MSMKEGHASLLSLLPHRPPFLFLHGVRNLQPDHGAAGWWTLQGDEPFFAGHFPDSPIVPGVLIVESLAQLSGLIVGAKRPSVNELAGRVMAPDQAETESSLTGWKRPFPGRLAHVDVRFDAPAAPPIEIELESKFIRALGSVHQFEVRAAARGRTVARGTISLSFFHEPNTKLPGLAP